MSLTSANSGLEIIIIRLEYVLRYSRQCVLEGTHCVLPSSKMASFDSYRDIMRVEMRKLLLMGDYSELDCGGMRKASI